MGQQTLQFTEHLLWLVKIGGIVQTYLHTWWYKIVRYVFTILKYVQLGRMCLHNCTCSWMWRQAHMYNSLQNMTRLLRKTVQPLQQLKLQFSVQQHPPSHQLSPCHFRHPWITHLKTVKSSVHTILAEDNTDKTMKPWDMRIDGHTRFLHYIHAYEVRSRRVMPWVIIFVRMYDA